MVILQAQGNIWLKNLVQMRELFWKKGGKELQSDKMKVKKYLHLKKAGKNSLEKYSRGV